MLRILHSVSNMDRGGIETMLMNYYRHMDRSLVQFDFLLNKRAPGAYDAEILQLGGRLYYGPGLDPLHYQAYLRRVQQILAREPQIGILHAHNEAMGFYALSGAKRAGLPVRIAHAHNTRIQLDHKWPLKMFCRQGLPAAATHLWACSQDAGCYFFGRQNWGGHGMVLPNAIEVEHFRFDPALRAQMRVRHGFADRLVVGHVGRFAPQKNHLRLLELFAALVRCRPDAVLVLVGDGGQRDAVCRKARQMGLGDRVFFAGEQSDVRPWYQMMDLFWLPSRFEGLPVVGVEAQAAGLPCVFSDRVPSEALLSGHALRLPLTDESLWVQRSLQLIAQPADRAEGASVVRRAGYDITAEAARLQALYLALAQG